MAGTVLYELDEHVATITYNRPEARNAINAELRRDLNAAWERFRDDEDAWVGIVTGAGDSFCAGADMKDAGGSAGTWPGSFWEIPTVNSYESGLEVWKPTIAAVNGYCLGYGLTLVTRCDFVIAADDAQFGFPEVRLGVPTIVGALRLPERVGWSNAMELLLSGDRVDSARAHEMGLAWKVVPRDELMTEARRLADRLLHAAPLAARATKEVATRGRYLPWLEAVRFGEQDLAGHGRIHDAGRDVDGVAEVVAGPVQGRPRVDADADRGKVGIASKVGLGCNCEPHGGGRVAEREHESVTNVLHELAVVLDEQWTNDRVDPIEHVHRCVVAACLREGGERGDVDERDRGLDRAELPRLPVGFGEMEERVLHHRFEQILAMQPLDHRFDERPEVPFDAGDHPLDVLLGRTFGHQAFVDVHVDHSDLTVRDAPQ